MAHSLENQDVPEVITKLFSQCLEAKEFSYSPYSHFRVGCAVLADNGRIFQGCNVENVSYGLSICAERTALVKAVSSGCRNFTAIAVTTDMAEEFATPCGNCRQFMAEFGLDYDVYLLRKDRQFVKTTVGDLLPKAFTPDTLARANGHKETVD